METIHVMNLKSLKDSGELRIRPITVLVGQNSSGKSSLIRCIPLLKQSAESKTLGTVLWSGKYVDYGSFEESINNKAESNIPREITFKFSLRISIENSRSYVINDSNAKVLIRVSGDEHSKNSYTDITYEVYGNSISFKTNPDHKIISFSINGSDFTKQVNELYIAYKIYTITPAFYKNSRGTMAIDVQTQLLAKEIRKHVHHRTSDERTHRIARGLKFGDDETIKKSLSSKFWSVIMVQKKCRNGESIARTLNH